MIKTDLEALLQDYKNLDGTIATENTMNNPDAKDYIMYERYKNILPSPNTLINQEDTTTLTHTTSYFQSFNIRRFWFKDSKPKINLKENEILAFQEGRNIILKPGRYVGGGEVENSEIGDRYSEFVYVYDPQKIRKSTNNFYLQTYGQFLLNNTNQHIIRFYFSLIPDKDKVNDFTDKIREYFNERRIPFQFKTPFALNNFGRGDTLVLYLSQSHYFYVVAFINELVLEGLKKDIFKDNLPLFVKQLKFSQGTKSCKIGFAEDPFFAGLDSFGEHRCGLVYNIINEIGKNKDSVTIDEIITEITKQYKEDKFYCNPHTEFDYKFDNYFGKSDLPIYYCADSKLSWWTKPVYLTFNLVALNYGLDFMERAIWTNDKSFTWFTWDTADGSYRVVTNNERLEIYTFLYQLLQINYNRRRFPKNVIRIIEENGGDNKSIWKGIVKESKETWSDIIEEAEQDASWLERISSWMPTTRLNQEETNVEERIGKWVETLQKWNPKNITDEEIHKFDIFADKKETVRFAFRMYNKFVKPNYPIKNKQGNYEYVPTDKGKLKIAIVMLYVYCPILFERTSQGESSPRSPSQQWWKKLPFLH